MKNHILRYLKQAPGPVKRPELLSFVRLQMNDVNIKDRAMRKAIEEMIKDDGYVIASSEAGYYLVRTQDDLYETMEYLDKKAAAIAIRKNTLLKNWTERQKKLSEKPEIQGNLFDSVVNEMCTTDS